MKKILLLPLLFIFLGNPSFSQKSYQIELLNLVQYNETEYRFDVRMRNSSPDPVGVDAFAIEGIQWQLVYNTALLNGGALNKTYMYYIDGTTDLVGTSIIPQSANFSTDQTIMQWITAPLAINGITTLFNDGNWKRIGTFRVVLRDISTSPGSKAKNWGDGLLNLAFNGATNNIVNECPYFEEEGVCYRATSEFTTISAQVLTNSVVNKAFFSRCFTGNGSYSDAARWNNVVATTDPSYHVVPSSASNNISIGGYTSNLAGTLTIVPGTCTLTDNRTINDLTVKSTSSLTINPAIQLTVSGTLYVDNISNTALLLKSTASGSASLIHSTPGVNGTVERYITGWTGSPTPANHGWHFLSSPVAAQPISVFHTAGTGNDFYKWVESNPNAEKWVNRTATGGGLNGSFETNFAVGTTGYLMANAATSTPVFTGVLNVSNVPVSGLTNSTGTFHAGWHLLGNPFSCALGFNLGTWNRSNIGAVAQIWNELNASYTVLSGSQVIPAMNGFMVYSAVAGGSLTIPADARVQDNTAWYKSNTTTERILLKAVDPDGQTAQETTIAFNNDATDGFDLQYDGYFMSGWAPSFYSTANTESFALNTLPALSSDLVIPLGFVKNSNTNFNISLVENIPGVTVYLKDLLLNRDQDLTTFPVYNFTSADGDNANRFQLRFGTVLVNETSKAQPVNIYGVNNTIYIASKTGQVMTGDVIVYNMIGQEMISQQLSQNGSTKIPVNSGTGYYLVKVITPDQIFSGKVFIK